MFLFGPPDVEKMKARKDVKGLIKATGYSKDYGKIRQSAILALIEIGIPAVDPLIAALESKNDDMRKASTEALCKIGAPAVEPLIVALKGKSSAMRKAAAEILGNIGNDHAVEPLVDTLRDAEPNVRATAAEALGQLGSVRATQPLISTLKDKDSDVRKVAAKTLKSMGASAVEQVILALGDSDKEMRLAAARALGEIGDPCAVEHLLAALKDKESNVRAAVVESLGKLGDTRAVAPLITALNDTDNGVSAGAAEALGQLGDPRAVGPLIDAFKKWAKKGFIHGIEKAARALDRFGYAIVAPLLPMCEERSLLYATALTGTLVSLEAAARGSRDEGLQMLAKTKAVFDVIKEKEQQIQQKAQQIIGDLVAQHLKEQSRQPQPLSEESHFQRYSGSGLCDVCNRNIESGEAYLVPVDVFYSSRKYRNWLANGPIVFLYGNYHDHADVAV